MLDPEFDSSEITMHPRLNGSSVLTIKYGVIEKLISKSTPPFITPLVQHMSSVEQFFDGEGSGSADSDGLWFLTTQLVEFFQRHFSLSGKESGQGRTCNPAFSFTYGTKRVETEVDSDSDELVFAKEETKDPEFDIVIEGGEQLSGDAAASAKPIAAPPATSPAQSSPPSSSDAAASAVAPPAIAAVAQAKPPPPITKAPQGSQQQDKPGKPSVPKLQQTSKYPAGVFVDPKGRTGLPKPAPSVSKE